MLLTSATGATWESPWIAGGGMFAGALNTTRSTAFEEFSIPRAAYERLGDGPVTLKIDFALVELRDQAPFQLTVSTHGDLAPGVGFCALDEAYAAIQCRSAFRGSDYFAVSTFRRPGPTCVGPPAPLEPAYGFIGDPRATPASLHISPVLVGGLHLGGGSGRTATLCPGTPIAFVEKRPERRIEVQMPGTSIELKDYVGAVKVK
jgi:hypothetical protein